MKIIYNNPKEDFYEFIKAIEKKFQINEKKSFEKKFLKLVEKGTTSKTPLEINEFENSFFNIIKEFSSLSLKDNISYMEKEIISVKGNRDGT
jgi:hypothetical protein